MPTRRWRWRHCWRRCGPTSSSTNVMPVHQRPSAREHSARRHLLSGATDEGRSDQLVAVAPDRRCRRQVRHPNDQAHRRPTDRPARRTQGGLPAVWADLEMPSGYAYGKSFRTVKTCVGTTFAGYGVGDSTALGIAIEERYQGLASPAKMKLAVTDARATARKRSARTSASSRSATVGGRYTSGARRGARPQG